MPLLRLIQAGVVLPILLLPLICLCQFVPGQATPPHLLLFSASHSHAESTLSDDDLAALALSTGQPVSIGDDGEIIIGYGDAPPLVDNAGCGFSKNAGLLEFSPQLSASLPAAVSALAPHYAGAAAVRPPLSLRQYFPEPPEQPPSAA